MRTKAHLTALIEFDASGELQAIFLNAGGDEEERKLKEALSRLIQPTLWERVAELLSLRTADGKSR